jgi:hypothetical protein
MCMAIHMNIIARAVYLPLNELQLIQRSSLKNTMIIGLHTEQTPIMTTLLIKLSTA